MKYYHVEENGNIMTLETQQKPEWLNHNEYWKESLNEAIESTRKKLEFEINLPKNRLIEAENKLNLFEKNIKDIN